MAMDLTLRPFWRWPSLLDEDFDDLLPATGNQASGLSVSEDDKHVYVTAALPGVDEKAIDITFDKGVLWIKGEVLEEETDKKRKYYRKSTGVFSYRVAVPGDIDPNVEPDATFKNGVMTVKFAKSPKAQPKKIAVKAAK